MRKILTIGGNDVAFESAAVTPYFYKSEFGRDYFSDMIKMSKALQDVDKLDQLSYDDLEHVDLNVISQLAWACAKTADRNNTKPYLDWLIENPDFNMFEHGAEIAQLVVTGMQAKKK